MKKIYILVNICFCLALQQGCLLPRLHPIVIEENPSDWLHDLANSDSNATWRLIVSKSPDVVYKRLEVVAISHHGPDDWYVITERGCDIWGYNARKKNHDLVAQSVACDKLKDRESCFTVTNSSSISVIQDGVLSVKRDSSSQLRSCVRVDLKQVFSENKWCAMVWLDDGIKGMCYVRGESFRREKRIEESLVGASAENVGRYWQIQLEATNYADFCAELALRRSH